MYIVNGIAYAGESAQPLSVSAICPLKERRLWVRFSTGEAKVFDCTPLLQRPAFAPLSDQSVFEGVRIEYGAPVWNGGEIDIAPEHLYELGPDPTDADCVKLARDYPGSAPSPSRSAR